MKKKAQRHKGAKPQSEKFSYPSMRRSYDNRRAEKIL
jgi:hypothetical protein